jgi:hypothetical protein
MLRDQYADTTNSSRAYSGDNYYNQAVGQQAAAEYQKGLAGVRDWGFNANVSGKNQYNQREYEIQTAQAAERARVEQQNQALKAGNADRIAYYLNKFGVDAAGLPQTVAQIKRDKEMMPWLSSENYKITPNGEKFKEPVIGGPRFFDNRIEDTNGKPMTAKEAQDFLRASKTKKK